MFDKNIIANEGNEKDLSALIDAYKRHYPILEESRLKKFRKVVEPDQRKL